ncbi:MAG: GFA family protein, partial [Microvirga sp.]
FGAFYGPLVTGHGLEYTRGDPSGFQSSDKVRRGFCAACGTPLIYDAGKEPEVAIGTLDDPALATPVLQLDLADKLPFVDGIHALSVREFTSDSPAGKFMASIESHQHPDHDTQDWPQ